MRPPGYPTCVGHSPELEEDSPGTYQHPTSGTDSPNGQGETQQGLGDAPQNFQTGRVHTQGFGQHHGQTAMGNIYVPLTKPLLQPLWEWKGAVESSGRPNRLARTFAKLC